MAQVGAQDKPVLTSRQREVFALVAEGLSNREIADKLGISLDGAKWHVSELLGRLGVDDREQLARLWPEYRREPRRTWLGKPAIAFAAGAAGLATVAVAAFAVLLVPGDEEAMPEAVASPSPPSIACPVDIAVCEFANRVEYEFREGDPQSLISPKSQHHPESGIIEAGIRGWREKPFFPHVLGIGCSVNTAGQLCVEAFSLVLTASPEDDQDKITDRVLLGFLRDGDDLPIITLNRLVGGSFNPVSLQADAACTMVVLDTPIDCVSVRFFPYSSGSPVPRPVVAAQTVPPAGDPLDGVNVVELKAGMQAGIGQDTQVYYSTGCSQCGRPRIPNLYRIYRDTSGNVRTDDLFGPLLHRAGGYPNSVAADWERGRLLVQMCTVGYCGGEGDPSPDAKSRLYESRDGGITFTEEPGDFPVAGRLVGFLSNEALVSQGEKVGLDYQIRFYLHPSGTELHPPAPIGKAEANVDHGDLPGWLSYEPKSGYYDNAGKLIVPSAPGRDLVFAPPLDSGWLVLWTGSPGEGHTFGVLDGQRKVVGAFHTQQFADLRGIQLPDGRLAGNVYLLEPFGFGVDGGGDSCKEGQPIYPSIVDWVRGTVHPIIELGDCAANGHKFINAIVARPVVRVNTPGDCLNLRAEPNTVSEVLGCFADGVLLPQRLEGSPPVVAGWVAVLSPDLETSGWVAEQFVSP